LYKFATHYHKHFFQTSHRCNNIGGRYVKTFFILQKHRSIFLAALFLASIRLIFFLATMIWPIQNEAGVPVSPLVQSGTDLHYYKSVAVRLEETDALAVAGLYLRFYQDLRLPNYLAVGAQAALTDIRVQATGLLEYVNVGPAFPKLISLFDYRPDNTLALATAFLVIGMVAGIAWISWLHAAGTPTIWLFFFALLPSPNYFSISLGTDLPFMLATGLFFWSYRDDRWSKLNVPVWFGAIVLMALLRPTALSVLAFVFIDLCLMRKAPIAIGARAAIALAVLGLLTITLAYYLPHGVHVIGSSSKLKYFGVMVSEYYGGLFPAFPAWLDKSLSAFLLIGAKVLYFVGLRPSFGGTETWLVLLRSAPGLVLLPGLAWGLIMSGWRMRLFLVLFLVPIIAGPAQDRYSLPIQPILLFYCACAYSRAIAALFPQIQQASKDGPNFFNTWITPSLVKMTAGLKLP
jgi:hypothetical protein